MPSSFARCSRVYQRGRSRPARAWRSTRSRSCASVSKRPFPTSQSPPAGRKAATRECIKEAVPDQPELIATARPARKECIKEAVPDQPELRDTAFFMAARSVSKRPFPTSQSDSSHLNHCAIECIKEAVPDQPERDQPDNNGETRVYQRGRSRPARADRAGEPQVEPSVSKRPFPTSQSPQVEDIHALRECIKEAVPDQPEQGTGS